MLYIRTTESQHNSSDDGTNISRTEQCEFNVTIKRCLLKEFTSHLQLEKAGAEEGTECSEMTDEHLNRALSSYFYKSSSYEWFS
jgi:hypothetical protein